MLDITSGVPEANDGLRAALPVLGTGQWEAYAALANWGLAMGGTLIAQGPGGGANPGGSQTWRYWIWPRYQIVARLWCISLSMRPGIVGPGATVDTHNATGTFAIDGTNVRSWRIDPTGYTRTTNFRFVQTVETPTADPGEITFGFAVNADAGDAVYMDALACYEIRRATNTTFGPTPSALGALHAPAPPPGSVQTGAIISEGGIASVSAGGLMLLGMHEEMLQTEMRRSCLFSDFRPAGLNMGTSYTSVYRRDPALLARTRYAGETVRAVDLAVYGNGPSGSTARITMTSGDTFTIALVDGVPGWHTTQVDIETEDPSRWGIDGGIRGGTRDRIKLEGRRVGGSDGDCKIYGMCVAEAT